MVAAYFNQLHILVYALLNLNNPVAYFNPVYLYISLCIFNQFANLNRDDCFEVVVAMYLTLYGVGFRV